METNKKKSTKAKSGKDEPRQKKSLLFKLFKWGMIIGIWCFLILIGIIAYYCHDLPDVASAAEFDRKRSITVYADDKETVIARYGELLGKNLTYEDLPQTLIHAVLATEDRRYFYHYGIDPIGILRATITNVQKKRIAQGGSTITQQLAKNLFLSSNKTLKRKIQEAILAVWLEARYTKKEILAAYLNRVYMGAGAYGVDAASQIYFQKKVSDLTREESAILAGVLKAPSRYNPISSPEKSKERMALVLKLMDENDSGLQPAESSDSSNKNWKKSGDTVIPAIKPFTISYPNSEGRYFADWVVEQLSEYINSPEKDLIVYTTLNLEKQKAALAIASKKVEKFITSKNKDKFKAPPEFAGVFADKNGAIKIFLGGSDYNKSQFNRASQAMRQPGSAFKPFVYLSALKQGKGLNDMINDNKFRKNGYSPENHSGVYHGNVPLWQALSQSYNVAAVRLLAQTGIDNTIRTAYDLGFENEIQPDLSIALGTTETSVINIVQTYHSIARYNKNDKSIYGITSIKTANGDVLFERENKRENSTYNTMGKNTRLAYEQLIFMMQNVVTEGSGKKAGTGFPVAGKTGTSQNNRDAWFLGFSSEYTGGIWIGYDDNTPMPGVYGGTLPAEIWAQTMKQLHKGRRSRALINTEFTLERKENRLQEEEEFESFLDRLFGREEANINDKNSNKRSNARQYNNDRDAPRRRMGNNRNGL